MTAANPWALPLLQRPKPENGMWGDPDVQSDLYQHKQTKRIMILCLSKGLYLRSLFAVIKVFGIVFYQNFQNDQATLKLQLRPQGPPSEIFVRI